MDINATLLPSNAFIYTNDDTSRTTNQANSNTDSSNASSRNTSRKAESIEPEWLDLTKNADSTYSYVDSKVAANSEPTGWTYDMAGQLNEVAIADGTSGSSLIDVWA